MIKHIKIKVYGQVQGVGFRWSSYEKFVDLGLTGKAENGEDGTVKIDVQGEEFAIQKLIEWCHKGPMGARVTKVEINEILPQHGDIESQNSQSQSNS